MRRSPTSDAQDFAPASQWMPSPTAPAAWIHFPSVSDSPPSWISTSRSQNPASGMGIAAT